MSDRLIEASNVPNSSDSITPEDKLVAQAIETREQKKVRRAQVYDRGLLGDRLHVDLPPEVYGEWVPNNTLSVHQKETLGFRIDTEYARQRALHDKGDSASYVGDCVFMVCDMDDKVILDEIRRERYDKIHAPKGGKQAEERAFLNSNDPINNATSSSRVHVARKTDISNAIRSAQTNNS